MAREISSSRWASAFGHGRLPAIDLDLHRQIEQAVEAGLLFRVRIVVPDFLHLLAELLQQGLVLRQQGQVGDAVRQIAAAGGRLTLLQPGPGFGHDVLGKIPAHPVFRIRQLQAQAGVISCRLPGGAGNGHAGTGRRCRRDGGDLCGIPLAAKGCGGNAANAGIAADCGKGRGGAHQSSPGGAAKSAGGWLMPDFHAEVMPER